MAKQATVEWNSSRTDRIPALGKSSVRDGKHYFAVKFSPNWDKLWDYIFAFGIARENFPGIKSSI